MYLPGIERFRMGMNMSGNFDFVERFFFFFFFLWNCEGKDNYRFFFFRDLMLPFFLYIFLFSAIISEIMDFAEEIRNSLQIYFHELRYSWEFAAR